MNGKGQVDKKIAYYHLPGLFEFQEFYKEFLILFQQHREYFYDWCQIASIYGAPADCLWGGGRAGYGDALDDDHGKRLLEIMEEMGISARLTFSNSLLTEKDLSDKKCNDLCRTFSHSDQTVSGTDFREMLSLGHAQNGVIVHSDFLVDYLKEHYPELYLVSSTTKVLTDFSDFLQEVNRVDFRYVVPDFRLNKDFENLEQLSQEQKDKVEFLCNECCWFACKDRKACYEDVSRKNLGDLETDHRCKAPGGNEGYRFSKAMENPGFISLTDIQEIYLPMGFSNFKIEGRSLGSAMILEFLLYYMTKPEYQIHVREQLYLDAMLDLF